MRPRTLRAKGTAQHRDTAGGAGTSMSRWCSELVRVDPQMASYVRSVSAEETTKPARIAAVLAAAGIAAHPQFSFMLPNEKVALVAKCQELESDGWLLTIRVADTATGMVVYRVLDSDVRSIESGLRHLKGRRELLATVTPNTMPTVSGTVLARRGDITLEMVYGPHHWVTKAPPTGIELKWCSFSFPHLSVVYSTDDPADRGRLYRHLRAVIRIGLGMNLVDCARSGSSLYAEFQWDGRSGYKFFDISFDQVWTGTRGSS